MRGTLAVLTLACTSLVHGEELADGVMASHYPSCDALQNLNLHRARIVDAKGVSDGRFGIEEHGSFDSPLVEELPEFCRVIGSASPVEGSIIGFEAWLPTDGWNGKLLMLGNGGYSSSIPYMQMAEYLRRGYATAATDTGHIGDDPVFARDNPVSIVDWGDRAVHASRLHAGTVIASFYGETPQYSYFAGCSTGGHQALMAAQRYPEDFDGIIAGAPGHNRTHLNAGFLWQFMRNHTRAGQEIVPADKLAMINAAVLAQCRDNNGTRSGGLPADPYLDDPLTCDFDPQKLACGADREADCLSSEQIEALDAIYDGPRNPRTGKRIYFGQTPGSEAAGGPPALPGWSFYWADPRQRERPARLSFWRYWAFDDPEWNWWDFDFDADMSIVDQRLAPVINAMDADLSGFRRAGGKLLHFHGLNDPVVPATDSISYFERANARGNGVEDFYRLFLAPGVEHCRGGPGPDEFDLLTALEDWVERGEAPERIIATGRTVQSPDGAGEFTRPLCPYPKYAEFSGAGDSDRAETFFCGADRRRPSVPEIGSTYLR